VQYRDLIADELWADKESVRLEIKPRPPAHAARKARVEAPVLVEKKRLKEWCMKAAVKKALTTPTAFRGRQFPTKFTLRT
jgi:hypothetical protein